MELTDIPGDGYDEEDPLLAAALDRAEEQSAQLGEAVRTLVPLQASFEESKHA